MLSSCPIDVTIKKFWTWVTDLTFSPSGADEPIS